MVLVWAEPNNLYPARRESEREENGFVHQNPIDRAEPVNLNSRWCSNRAAFSVDNVA